MPLFKVYISSTYIDLKEHRRAVREFFGKFRDKFEIISMEDYVADSEQTMDACIADVNRCDFYILIVAGRYGSIPAETDRVKNPDKLSVTHAEYLAAKQGNKKIFAFFAHDKSGFETDYDTDPAIKKFKEEKLSALKQDVRNNFLTHPEGFNSPYQLALMVAESMIRAGEKYKDLLSDGAKQFMERFISEDRIYCLDRVPQITTYSTTTIQNKTPFKAFIIHGEKDNLVESLQKRITSLTLNIPKSRVYKLSFNSVFGSGTEYEDAKQTYLNGALDQLFRPTHPAVSAADFKQLTTFINSLQSDRRVALVINWAKLLDGENDPRLQFLKQLLQEIHEACKENKCCDIYFFINIMYEAADEPAFQKIIRNLSEFADRSDKFLVALPKLNDVVNEDLNVWIETYITDVPYKKNKILTECLPELDDEFSMQEAEEKMYEFINRINSRDPDVLKILN